VQFIKDKLGGSLAGKKIAYLYFDNPAGHEPMVMLDALKQQEKFELKEFAVPPPFAPSGAEPIQLSARMAAEMLLCFGLRPRFQCAGAASGNPVTSITLPAARSA
jgi:branched-chain amino acid transport system substrate-binding protein